MKHLFKNPLFYVCLILFLAVGFLVVDFVGATTSFSEPTELFPGGNPELPIDISPVSQTKEGELTVNELIITPAGNLYLNGSGICMKESVSGAITCKNYWNQMITGVIKGDSLQIHTYGSGRSGSDLPGTYTARNVFFDDVYSGSETGWPGSYGSLITFMGRSGHEGLQIFQMPSYTADLRVRSTWYDQSNGWGSWRTVAFTDSPSFSGNVGIGETNPSKELDVVGDILASGTICDSTGCIGSGGSGGTTITLKYITELHRNTLYIGEWTYCTLYNAVSVEKSLEYCRVSPHASMATLPGENDPSWDMTYEGTTSWYLRNEEGGGVNADCRAVCFRF